MQHAYRCYKLITLYFLFVLQFQSSLSELGRLYLRDKFTSDSDQVSFYKETCTDLTLLKCTMMILIICVSHSIPFNSISVQGDGVV